MGEAVDLKLRKIGTSVGVIFPKKILENENLKEGEYITVAILKKDLNLIDESFGMFKGARVPFERDRIDRVERYLNQRKNAA